MKKPMLILTLLLTIFFIFIWLVDTISPNFNPNYQPLLGFLKITQMLLQTTTGLD